MLPFLDAGLAGCHTEADQLGALAQAVLQFGEAREARETPDARPSRRSGPATELAARLAGRDDIT
jgi:hypothetical protein